MSSVRKSDRKKKEPERLVYETNPIAKKSGTKKTGPKKIAKVIVKKAPVKVLKRSGVKVEAPVKKVAIKKAKATKSKAVITKSKRTSGPPPKMAKTTSSGRKMPRKYVSDNSADESSEPEITAGSKKRKRTASSTKPPKVSALSKLSEDQLNELNSLSVPDLKARLKLNQQLMSGSKKELYNRVVDCAVNGSFPKCPQCGGGRLKASGSGYKCPGYMDDVTFINCDYYSTSIVRPPWNKLDGQQI